MQSIVNIDCWPPVVNKDRFFNIVKMLTVKYKFKLVVNLGHLLISHVNMGHLVNFITTEELAFHSLASYSRID